MNTKMESVYVCRISNNTDQLYVVTSDQERAIHSGLNLSQPGSNEYLFTSFFLWTSCEMECS